MKKADIILITVCYILIFGVRKYLEFYPWENADPYMYFTCFAGFGLRTPYRIPFIICEVALFINIAKKYTWQDGKIPSILLALLLFSNYDILFFLVYGFWLIIPLDNVYIPIFKVPDFPLGFTITLVIAGVINYILSVWLIKKFYVRIKKVFRMIFSKSRSK
jgi:hypothetical protein